MSRTNLNAAQRDYLKREWAKRPFGLIDFARLQAKATKVSAKEVSEFIARSPEYGRYAQSVKVAKAGGVRFYPEKFTDHELKRGGLMQFDVCFISGHLGSPIVLQGTDSYSKLTYLETLGRATAAATAAAISRILDRITYKVSAILTDRGSNFLAPVVRSLFKQRNIRHVITKPM